MDEHPLLQRLSADRNLRRGVLIAAFSGWNDAGEAATGAVDAIAHLVDAAATAQIDPEEFFDFQVHRPETRRDASAGRTLDWPANRFQVAKIGTRDVVLLSGVEPNLRWRRFTDTVLSYVSALDVRSVVCVGALQVDTPHTRPVPLSGRATSMQRMRELGVRHSDYEGPTGITGVLTHTAMERGFDTASIWAGVPHYLANTTYAAAAHALAQAIIRALDLDIDLTPLAEAAGEQQREIAEIVAQDDDLSVYVTELESRVDEEDRAEESLDQIGADKVTGDELAAAFEQYLADRDERTGES